ncbi:TIGR02391 family protein, partial [Nitrospirales bacterium NOB]|nr:TIGR02391 family protein [Nitrospirales bacterium NOB]
MNLRQVRHTSDVGPAIAGIRAALPKREKPPPLVTTEDFWTSRHIDPLIVKASCSLFESGHYAQAVREAMQALDRKVAKRAGLQGSGVAMMRSAFSPDSPRLRWNNFKGLSSRDQQEGYMQLFAGAIAGVRNPRSHEPDHADDRETCEDLL